MAETSGSGNGIMSEWLASESNYQLASLDATTAIVRGIVSLLGNNAHEQRQLEAMRIKAEYEETLARIEADKEVEKVRLREKRLAVEKIVDSLLSAYNGKLEAMERARAQCDSFFRDQISGVDVLINKLLIERNNSGLTDYALLASIANRLIESKERFVSEYKEMMIDFNYKIQCMELKMDNACALKLINMEG